MKRTVVNTLPCLIGLALASLAGCQAPTERTPRRQRGEQLAKLETVRPERGKLLLQGEYTATVEAWQKTVVSAQVPGVIKEIPADIDIGSSVEQGQKLLEMDVPDVRADLDGKTALLEQAQNSRSQTVEAGKVAAQEVKESQAHEKKQQAEVDFRQLQYSRLAGLVEKQTVQPQQMEEASLKLSTAQAALKAIQAQIVTRQVKEQAAQVELKVADSSIEVAAAEVARLRALVDFAVVKAPFAGIITKRWVDRGTTVKDSSLPLLTLMQTDVVRVLIDVPERDVPHLRPSEASEGNEGNRVVLHVPALIELVPKGEFQGRVTRTASALDPVTRTMRVEIHLENKSGYLRPQMTGKASVLLARRDEALTLPSTALTRAGGKWFVYCLDQTEGNPPKGVVKRVEVETGLDDGSRVEIRGGLTGRELVVARSSSAGLEGERVIGVPLAEEEKDAQLP
jgi:HlyD family secretion protein